MHSLQNIAGHSRRSHLRNWLVASLVAAGFSNNGGRTAQAANLVGSSLALAAGEDISVSYRRVEVDGHSVFFREAGSRDAPTILLLHGFPNSSFMFRNLMPMLAGTYHLVAPDLPGFGFSDAPDHSTFPYTFDHLTGVIEQFTDALALKRFSIYVFDYGAPVGFQLAMRRPERVDALISQNGNAYDEGLSPGWESSRVYWANPTEEKRAALRVRLEPKTNRWRYLAGVPDETRIAPESYLLDSTLLARPGIDEAQLDLFLDYRRNVEAYPAIQSYFRTRRPPLLAVWGKNDPFFLPAGAEAFRRDLPDAEVHLLDTGHFALETHSREISGLIADFLGRKLPPRSAR